MLRKSLVSMALLALAAGTAQASTLTYTWTGGTSLTDIHQLGHLGLFDSSLGTLTSVELILQGDSTTDFSVYNHSAQSQRFRATSSLYLDFFSSHAGLSSVLSMSNPGLTLTNNTGLQQVRAGETLQLLSLSASDFVSLSSDFLLSGLLPQFSAAGGGDFTIGCDSTTGLTVVGGGGNLDSSQKTFAGCGASVVYTFTEAAPAPAVPEPGSFALAGLALCGLGLGRRRSMR